MNLVSNEELMKVSGGAIKSVIWYFIGGGITFLAGLFSGMVNPKSCNK
jgi:lactobin A/cerein 7B family class IIb bacteriocin